MWTGLALARFIFSFLVLCAHLTVTVPPDDFFYRTIAPLGPATAVYGFLIVSGFSIAASLERSDKGFYSRRLLRIVPLYWLCLLLSFFLRVFGGKGIDIGFDFLHYPDLKSLLFNALFLQGLVVPGNDFRINAVIWTIAIEVFFYALAPFLFKIRKSVVLKTFILSSFFIFCTYGAYNLPYYGLANHGVGIIALGWWWLLGFWFWFNRDKELARFGLLAIGLIALSLNSIYSRQFDVITYTLGCLIICYSDRVKWRFKSAISTLGDISYPLYLFHWPLLLILKQSGVTSGIAAVFICLAFSLLLDRFYDRPIKQFFRSRKTAKIKEKTA